MGKRKMAVVLCICAAVVLTSAVMLYRHFHIYSAEDFGFEDIKSPNDADGDGMVDERDAVAILRYAAKLDAVLGGVAA